MKYITAFLFMTLCVAALQKGSKAEISATHTSLREADLPRLIPAKEFYAPRYRSLGHRISPDGKKLAWRERIQGKLTLRVRALKSGHTVTMNTPALTIRFYWTLDSRHLLLQAHMGRRGNWRLFLADTDFPQRRPRDIFPLKGATISSIFTPPAKPGSVLVMARPRTGRFPHLYEIDVKTGVHKLRAINPGNTQRWILNDKGDAVGRLQGHADGGWSVQAATGTANWTTLLKGEFTDVPMMGQYVPHGSSKVYMATNGERDTRALVTLDLDTGAQELVFQPPGADVSSILLDSTHRPLACLYHDDLPRYHYFDRRLQEDVETLLGPGPMLYQFMSASRDLMRLTIRTETDRAAKSIYLIDRRYGTKELLATHPLARYEEILSQTRPITVKARDGLSISGYLTIPEGTDGQRLPMVLKVHGGPWARDYWAFDPETQFLANRGYAVLEVNFRGSRGFGRSFIKKGYGELGGKMQDDLIDAADWAVAEGYADPEKVAIYGNSYGGYAALVGLTKTPGKFAAGVSVAGPSDLVSLVSTFSRRRAVTRAWWIRFAGDPAEPGVRKELAEQSPITYAHRVERPLLIVHGARDKSVSKAHSDRFVEKLREKDIPVEYLVFPDEGHKIISYKDRIEFARRLETFLAAHLGGRAGPTN